MDVNKAVVFFVTICTIFLFAAFLGIIIATSGNLLVGNIMALTGALLVSQTFVAVLVNCNKNSREPRDMFDFIKLLFLPYVLYAVYKGKHQ